MEARFLSGEPLFFLDCATQRTWLFSVVCVSDNQVNDEARNEHQAGNIGAKNNIQIHIFVTSYNAQANESRRIQSLKDRSSSKFAPRKSRMPTGVDTNIGFCIDELWERLHEPNGPPDEYLKRVCPPPGYIPDNKVGQHIFIWNGRPKWDPAFMSVASEPGQSDANVGVCFCGASIIGKQLQDACTKHSDPDKTMFRLHKENF
jgi:hypothetical protein